MPWARFDDQFPDHPKVLAVGPEAGWLFVCGVCYCARILTDGFIPAAQVRRLADLPDSDSLASRLVDAGLWERLPGGYQVHDYLEYNPCAADVKADRGDLKRIRAEAGRRGGVISGENRRSKREANGEANEANREANGKQTRSKNEPPYPYPSPSRVPDPVPDPVPECAERARGGLGGAILKFKDEYPATVHATDDETLVSVWRRIVLGQEDEDRTLRELVAWKSCLQWDDPQFVPSMENFLTRAKFRTIPNGRVEPSTADDKLRAKAKRFSERAMR